MVDGALTGGGPFSACSCRGLTDGSRSKTESSQTWIRTTGTAAQKPWISAAFRALRGYRRGL